jgi:hypothetical protein
MELRTIQIEEEAGRLIDDLRLPRDVLAAENVLLAIRLDLLDLTIEEERQVLNTSIVAQRPGLLLQNVVEWEVA